MIIEWLMDIAYNVSAWFLGLFGTDDPEQWMVDALDSVADWIQGASGLGAWIPWNLLIWVGGAVVATFLIALGVKVARWVVGLIPTMGGGT